MKIFSLKCPDCGAPVPRKGSQCESCGSYYEVEGRRTQLSTPAVRLYEGDDQFTFVYGPRSFFLLGRHHLQSHVPVRHREELDKLGISRKAAQVSLSQSGPTIQRIGQSRLVITTKQGVRKELGMFESAPLISGMTIDFGLRRHSWEVRICETSAGQIAVLLIEPDAIVRHLLITDDIDPTTYLDPRENLVHLGVVRPNFKDGWIPTDMEDAGELHSFPIDCRHVWHA